MSQLAPIPLSAPGDPPAFTPLANTPPAVPPTPAVAPHHPQRTQLLLHSWLMTSLGVLIVAVAALDLRIVQQYGFLRTSCLVAGIVAGCGASFSLGGAMHYLDAAAQPLPQPLHWFWKILFYFHKRLLLLLQLAMMAAAIAAVGALVFDWKIPGPDWDHLFRGPDYSVTAPQPEP